MICAAAAAARAPAARGARARSGRRTRARRRASRDHERRAVARDRLLARSLAAAASPSCASTLRPTASASVADGRDQHRVAPRRRARPATSRSAATSLASALVVGDDQDLRRAGDRVDVDLAEHLPLGLRDPRVARPDDLVDARHALGAVGERRHRLRAADRRTRDRRPRAAPRAASPATGPASPSRSRARPRPCAGTAVISTVDG